MDYWRWVCPNMIIVVRYLKRNRERCYFHFPRCPSVCHHNVVARIYQRDNYKSMMV